MDRRGFLKTLGLGGVALTLPKPLEIFAAKASDLTDPPLHVGLCRFRDVKFSVNSIGLFTGKEVITNYDRWMDFAEHWKIHVLIRRDDRSYFPLLEDWAVHHHNGLEPRVLLRGASYNILENDALDVWLVPAGKPKFPLSSVAITIYGPPKLGSIDISWINGQPVPPRFNMDEPDFIVQPLRAVRLERTRAIEMGLALPSDPFEAL